MKQQELQQEIDSILALLPSEQQAIVALRYEGGDALKKLIAKARHQLEELKGKLAKK